MTDNELLLAISEMLDIKLDSRLKPIESRLMKIEFILESNVIPRLQNIESCYTSAYERYKNGVDQIEAMQSDIEILKKVVAEHSEKLRSVS